MINCSFEDGGAALLRHVTVDVLVIKDSKVLLVKRTGKLLEGGKWGLAGGFVERDENLAQAASREVHEETGWVIQNLTLLAVVDMPERPAEDRQNIAFVYFAEATEKTGEADWESDDQQWFDFDNLPPAEQLAFDHGANIDLYKSYNEKSFPLPQFRS